MTDSKVGTMAKMAARGVAREEVGSIRDRLEPPADQFKVAAAEKVEAVAAQIRQLGSDMDRWQEAHVIARRLERTADYLRYRPAFDAAADVRSALERNNVLWVAGGVLAGYVAYRLIRSAQR